jgi:nicotinate-nucleotide pyrophosphorylase (carboxylating)
VSKIKLIVHSRDSTQLNAEHKPVPSSLHNFTCYNYFTLSTYWQTMLGYIMAYCKSFKGSNTSVNHFGVLPPMLVLDTILRNWLLEDIGRGDRTTERLTKKLAGKAKWKAKTSGVIAGLPIAARIFQLLDESVNFLSIVPEGVFFQQGEIVAEVDGPVEALLMGEQVALNIVMRMSGIATLTRKYVEKISDLPAKFVDMRKTTPGVRILERYATAVGGAVNHRIGLDDGVIIKKNHIIAAGGIGQAITQICQGIPYPLTVEVETGSLDEIEEVLQYRIDSIMLDNMPVNLINQAVYMIRQHESRIKIEASSGNINLESIRAVAETGVDYVSSSAPLTLSTWSDISMELQPFEIG